jgi:hypothetical protein
MSPDVSPLYMQAEDAIELAELLAFLGDWLDHAPRALRDALLSFCGPGYALGELYEPISLVLPSCSTAVLHIALSERSNETKHRLSVFYSHAHRARVSIPIQAVEYGFIPVPGYAQR